jgi:hypothetical protein
MGKNLSFRGRGSLAEFEPAGSIKPKEVLNK